MTQYLRICNRGVANKTALLVAGVSTSRGNDKTIGMFGTGAVYSLAKLLRDGLNVSIFCGNEKLTFGTESEALEDQTIYHITCGIDRKRPRRLSYSTDMGVADWTKTIYAVREFMSNAIDAAHAYFDGMKDVEVDITTSMRARPEWTQVYIELDDSHAGQNIRTWHKYLGRYFLHFHPRYKNELDAEVLDKVVSTDNNVRIYKQGVLVHEIPSEEHGSCFDYNLNGIELSESRNARRSQVREAAAKALGKASATQKETFLLHLRKNPNIWETQLDVNAILHKWEWLLPEEDRQEMQDTWAEAFTAVNGEEAVVVSEDKKETAAYVARKGHKPVVVSPDIIKLAESAGVKTDTTVLTGMEQKGRVECQPTSAHLEITKEVWDTIVGYGLHANRPYPGIMGFQEPMDAGSQTHGECGKSGYQNGTIYLHVDLGGSNLRKVVIEELAHHITEAGDNSRDLQDWTFRLAARLMSSERENITNDSGE